jgi:hypothetical protein
LPSGSRRTESAGRLFVNVFEVRYGRIGPGLRNAHVAHTGFDHRTYTFHPKTKTKTVF